MAIFRGDGGSGDSSTDAYASQIAVYAQTATTKANEAEASATAAATSATNAANSEDCLRRRRYRSSQQRHRSGN